MMWLYDIPTWLLAILIIGLTMAASLGGYVLLHRLFPGVRTEETSNLAVSFIGIVCAFHSLLLAFSAVLVWQDFQDSGQAVAMEANTVDDIYRDLTIYAGPTATGAAQTLRQYVRTVIDEEWPMLAEGNQSPKAAALLDDVFAQVGKLEPTTAREQVIFGEIFRGMNELVNDRHARIDDSQSAMPGIFWAIVLITTALLVTYTGLLPLTRINFAMVAGMSMSIGLIFFFIVALDHPFAGGASVEPEPLEDILAELDALEAGAQK
jgi:hypothetical protein